MIKPFRQPLEYSSKRSQLLRGKWRGNTHFMPPPWSIELDLFIDACNGCDLCIKACPETILTKGLQGFPQVDFKFGECDFCGKCASVCSTGALDKQTQPPWSYYAEVNIQCLAKKGVMCRTCADCCDERAIRFCLVIGGFSTPEVDPDLCTACGACVAPCPSDSIELIPTQKVKVIFQ